MGNFILGVILAVGLLAYVGAHDESNASARVDQVHADYDFCVVNGEPDAGVVVKGTITNVGQQGAIRVKVHLSTSEGEWDREQNVVFHAGEQKELRWLFHEPTINVSNVQSVVSASPSS